MNARRARRLSATVAALLALTTAGCASTSDAASKQSIDDVSAAISSAAATTATTAAPKDAGCNDADPTRSFAPVAPLPTPGQMPAGTPMGAIQEQRRVVIGVDENTIGFSYRDPDSGELVGFEADLAREVGRAMFGSDAAVRLVTLTTPEKIEKVASGEVDMTISVVSISCGRWGSVDFSIPYLSAFQQLMVRGDSKIADQADLSGRRVCVTAGSSSESFVRSTVPKARLRPVATRTECLTRLQEGEVDAIVLPSSIMAGLASQDPTMKVFEGALVDKAGAPALNIYGIAVQKTGNHELARYVNALLEQWHADGTLDRLQAANLPPELRMTTPAASYRD